ncbi:TPA: PT domain-containing protein [Haemophilus influenzae]|nr:PT domain-containing protein [Haemophilus influenzae]
MKRIYTDEPTNQLTNQPTNQPTKIIKPLR